MENETIDDLALLYDANCPICKCAINLIHENNPGIKIENARTKNRLLEIASKQQLDIDTGLIAEFDNRLYHGHEAVKLINRAINNKGLVAQLVTLVDRFPSIYPLLVTIRSLLLKLTGKKLINEHKS